MIYCVGLTYKYDRDLAKGPVVKRGPHTQPDGSRYDGGSVWRTAEEAKAFLVEKKTAMIRSVYGVDADWDRDTTEAPGKPYRLLLRDATIVRLERQP